VVHAFAADLLVAQADRVGGDLETSAETGQIRKPRAPGVFEVGQLQITISKGNGIHQGEDVPAPVGQRAHGGEPSCLRDRARLRARQLFKERGDLSGTAGVRRDQVSPVLDESEAAVIGALQGGARERGALEAPPLALREAPEGRAQALPVSHGQVVDLDLLTFEPVDAHAERRRDVEAAPEQRSLVAQLHRREPHEIAEGRDHRSALALEETEVERELRQPADDDQGLGVPRHDREETIDRWGVEASPEEGPEDRDGHDGGHGGELPREAASPRCGSGGADRQRREGRRQETRDAPRGGPALHARAPHQVLGLQTAGPGQRPELFE
jgi:hypothetical protein